MRTSIKVTLVGSVMLVGGAVGGVGGTILGIIHTFSGTATRGGSVDQLVEGIGNSLLSTLIGITIAFFGLWLVVGGLVAYFAGRNQNQLDTVCKQAA